MNPSSLESIPGVVPEHPYQYLLEQLRDVRKECAKHTGYSPAATSFLMSSADDVAALRDLISHYQTRCIEIQLAGEIKPEFQGDFLDFHREFAKKKRADHMEFALVSRDFAQLRLNEALHYKWEWQIISRATMLMELNGETVTEETICTFLGADFPPDYTFTFSIERILSEEKEEFYKELRNTLSVEADKAYSQAQKNGIMTSEQAKIIARYISHGETSDLYSISDHDLCRRVFTGGVTLKREDVKRLYPKPQKLAA